VERTTLACANGQAQHATKCMVNTNMSVGRLQQQHGEWSKQLVMSSNVLQFQQRHDALYTMRIAGQASQLCTARADRIFNSRYIGCDYTANAHNRQQLQL
jgi:hypothetical protein